MFTVIILILMLGTRVFPCVGEEHLTQDGLPYNVNDKNYKIRKFNLYGHEFDDTNGFVSKDSLPLDNTGYNEVSAVFCSQLKKVTGNE